MIYYKTLFRRIRDLKMKKLLFVALSAFALTSFGAWEKVGSIRIADIETLVKGVTKLGEFTGNQTLGIMASQAISKAKPFDFFGPGRPGVAMSFEFFMDSEELSEDPLEALDSLECAILYPVAQTKAEFLAAHPNAVDTNGYVRVCVCEKDDEDEEDEDDETYVVFSPDGKWVGYSDDLDQAKLALKGIKAAEKKLDGDLAKVVISPKGLTAITCALEHIDEEGALKKKDRKQMEMALELLKQMAAGSVGLRINECGLDIHGAVKAVQGSALSKIGKKTLDPNAWKTSGADALFASENAADAGVKTGSWTEVSSILKKYGIDTPFLSVVEPSPNYAVFTVDVPGAIEYFKCSSNVVKKLKDKKLGEELAALGQTKELIPLKGPAAGCAVEIKGFKPVADAATRFEATLPEAKDKPVYTRAFFSYYSLFKALTPVILANIDKEVRTMLEPLLAALPPEGEKGLAYAAWREKEAHQFILRIGADEFKGVSACIATFSAIRMQSAAKARSCAKAKNEESASKNDH